MSLPDNNPKTAFGILKPSVHAIPASALFYLGLAMKDGKEKYGIVNWREEAVSASTYFDAGQRHWWSFWDGEWADPKTKIPHLGYAMANAAILIDAIETSQLIDDRPRPGNIRELLDRFSEEHFK